MTLVFIASGVLCYLIGAIPFGFLIARSKGVDIRTVGSGNIGATNVLRSLGKGWGIFTFILDVLKGFIAGFLIPYLVSRQFNVGNIQVLQVFTACLAVAGHNWPVYLRFRGGKGIATTAGATLGIAPVAVLFAVLVWIVLFLLFRYVSLGSIIAAISMPVLGWILYAGDGKVVPIFLTLIGLLAVVRHRSNILRLLNGTESKFTRKEKS